MRKEILVAEDNREITKVLKLYLSSSGYNVTMVEDGVEALKKCQEIKFDLAIVDLMMPRMDGFELIGEIRKKSEMPILILSAKDKDFDKIHGLNIGADDYITKPFNPLELMARVNASLRRWEKSKVNQQDKKEIEVGELILDLDSFTLKKNGEEIALTASEYKILRILMSKPNQIFSKRKICELVYGDYYDADENVIMVHVSHIRDKIGDNSSGSSYIKTIRGLGYKIENK